MTPMWDRLARVRLTPAQIQAALVLCALVAVTSFVVSIMAFRSEVGVARTEAQQAIVQSDQARVQATATAREAVCQFVDVFRLHPNEPPPTTARGVYTAQRADALWRAVGCR